MKGVSDDIIIEINFGKSSHYENYLEIITTSQNRVVFSPFFYGRGIKKTIIQYGDNHEELNFVDENGFQNMFNLNLRQLQLSQNKRFKDILIVTKKLENIGSQFQRFNNKI